ncbi:MAG TPA: EAL domain-containing protein [Cycloclasticus sp.]|nr:EAL domain-containing protein [Cycloclasticus sp.]
MLISDNLIDDCNQGALELFGCADITSLISLSFLDLSPNKQFNGQRSKQEIERHNKMTLENGSCCFDWLSKRLDTGQTFFLEVTQTLLTLGKTQITQLSFRDMTERKAIEAKIAKHIYEDELTQLPNRLALTQRLQHVLAVYNRTHYRGALLFLDVQNFNSINNRYGYKTGDKLLITIANRLQTSVRKGDTVSRFGGDKFVIMFEDLNPDEFKAAQQVEAASRKILIDLEKPYQLNEKPLSISASIGIAMFSHDSRPAQLFQQSDTAMHRARNKQQNGVRFFDTAIQKTIDGRSEIITYLQEALVETAFELHYQLQVDAKGQPLGAEALLRLKHSTQGYIPPNEYLPIAEESGMIAPIGRWVLETACRQLKRWQESPATSKLTLTINVSPVEFLEENFIEHIQNTIKLNNIKHERLKIELTESMLTDISDEIIEKIIPLSNLGVQFSLDGFGKSHSSMHHLSKLPLNELKIDQSIISTLEDDPLNSRLVRAITIMTKELKIDVIAKGVEKKKQQQMLIKFGCFNYQGFLYAKPLSIDEFEALLETKKTLNT